MNDKPTHIDLFSGIGGFALAFQREGFQTIGHAEVEPFACAVYHEHFPESDCFGGVQNVTRNSVIERCGQLPVVVTGGFPCQPHSLAGKRKASADDRDLWSECKRVLRDIRPRFALFENVGGLLTSEQGLFYNRVLSDLAEIRFACLWQVVSAADVGAPHRRERVWMLCVDELADSYGGRCSHGQSEIVAAKAGINAQCDATASGEHGLADTAGDGGRENHWIGKSGFTYQTNALWPSRPGEQQFAWEPPRVVGDTASERPKPCRPKSARLKREAGITSSSVEVGNTEHAGFNAAEIDRCNSARDDRDATRTQPSGEFAGPSDGQLENANVGRCGERQPEGESVCWTRPANEATERKTQPALGSLPNGIPASMVRAWPQVHNRVGQLKGYGNAIVPQVARLFARAIYNQITCP